MAARRASGRVRTGAFPAMEWLEENMIPYYPLGVKKDKGAE